MKFINFLQVTVIKLEPVIKITLIFIILILLLGLFSIKEKIVPYTVVSSKIRCSIKLVLITDLHSCWYGENMSTLLEEIKSENPDAVLMGGDIYNDEKSESSNTEIFLKQISCMYKCYFVTGNHDSGTNKFTNVKDVKKEIKDYGITLLDGCYDTIEIHGQQINICGVDDPNIASKSFYKQLDNAAKACNNGNYSILLSHRPELIKKYLKYNFDLILSGHAHGGQWRIPKLLNGLLAPHQGLFPKYAGGRYDFGKTCFIVSRGLARESTPVPRIFNNPEVVIINIEHKNNR